MDIVGVYLLLQCLLIRMTGHGNMSLQSNRAVTLSIVYQVPEIMPSIMSVLLRRNTPPTGIQFSVAIFQ